MSIDNTTTHVVAAIAVILFLCYTVGWIFKRIQLPEVIGQLLVGIALGPSLLGQISGPAEHTIFPTKITPYLNVTSQVALVLFLFVVGYELDTRTLSRERRAVSIVSVTTAAVPALLMVISLVTLGGWYHATGEPRTGTFAFMLFMSVAVSITAVPVLASIIRERNLSATLPGVVAMTSAGLIDAVGWLALAGALVATSTALPGHRSWTTTALLLACYLAAVLLIARPVLRWWLRRPGALLTDKVPVAAAVAMGSAWVTASLGLHVIFGAFFAGLIMPRQADGVPDTSLLQPLQDAGRLLLPVFFVVSGLSVNINALHARDFALLGLVCAIAFAGKAGAGFVAARFAGIKKTNSAIIGILLNTRGLTELIALNVGLQAGIIHQRLYTVLVLMALVTTAATGPLLALVGRPGPGTRVAPDIVAEIVVGEG